MKHFITLITLLALVVASPDAMAQKQKRAKLPTQTTTKQNSGKKSSKSSAPKKSTSGKKHASSSERNVASPSNYEGDHVIYEAKKEVAPRPTKQDDGKVFFAVEQEPEYPGGKSALMNYLATHISYPAAAQENNITGKVVVRFVVKKDGSIGDIGILRSSGNELLDKEARRVVSTLPAFTPGYQNGKPVNSWYALPIKFSLQ